MDKRRTRAGRGKNRSTQKIKPYKIVIDFDCIVDYPTQLWNSVGTTYPQISRWQMPRFPSFSGDEWESVIPDDFSTFFSHAAKSHKLFDRVHLYDFALRELTYLRDKRAEVVFRIPLEFIDYGRQIISYLETRFPEDDRTTPIRFVFGDIENTRPAADVWVARDPSTIAALKANGIPHIVIDGPENAAISNVVRAIRWDHVGYFLRHGMIFEYTKQRYPENPLPELATDPHTQIWTDPLLPPSVESAALWVSREHKFTLEFDPDSKPTRGDRQSLTDSQRRSIDDARAFDLEQLRRKREVIGSMSHESLELIDRYPELAEKVTQRELRMQDVLRDIEQFFQVHPVRGTLPRSPSHEKTSTARFDLLRKHDMGLTKNFTSGKLAYLLAQNGGEIDFSDLAHVSPSNRVGMASERIAKLLLKEAGFKILEPRVRNRPSTKGVSSQTGIPVTYTVEDSGTQYQNEIDILAWREDTGYVAVEVKTTNKHGLDDPQVRWCNHLDNNGTFSTPDCIGIDKRTKNFTAKFGVIVIDVPSLAYANRESYSQVPSELGVVR